jgi:hypothetical protein
MQGQGQPEAHWHPSQAVDLTPLQTNVLFKLLGPEWGWCTFFCGHAQIADNYQRNYFACGKTELSALCIQLSNDVLVLQKGRCCGQLPG